MNCFQDCANCPFASVEKDAGKDILVNVVGLPQPDSLLDFSKAPVLTLLHRGYRIRLLNFTGDDYHIRRRILASRPDVVLDFADSLNLESSLQLTARLIDMDSPFVLALSRYGELLSTGHSIDCGTLGRFMGASVTPVEGEGDGMLPKLLSAVVDVFENPSHKHVHIPYGTDLEESIDKITARIAVSEHLCSSYHDRYLAVRLIDDSGYVYPEIEGDPVAEEVKAAALREAASLEREFGQSIHSLVANARIGFVQGALQETLRHGGDNSDHTVSQRIDSILTSRWLGFPILALVLYAMFQLTFTIGAWPQGWIESGIVSLGRWIHPRLGDGWFGSLVVNGIVQGVGAVLAFVPNIVILFFFLSVLEDSGYMARAAFLMDKLMHRIGLHGRSFVPMLIGFGCNVPAIMAARSIADRRDRTLTMLMIPFMSCSARLPVYLLFVSTFFARSKALVMIGIYLLGVLLSILFAFVMKKTRFFSKPEDDFVSELPPFRIPTFRNTGMHIWERLLDYLQKITTVILAASVIIWALEYFPSDRTDGGRLKEESYLASIGRAIEPVTSPLGFDWRMNVCLLTGLPAKEAIVSTMGILYHVDGEESLPQAIRDGGMTPGTALAFMAFVLLYFPCIATIGALKRETGRRWAVFSVVNSLSLAWIVAYLISVSFRILSILA